MYIIEKTELKAANLQLLLIINEFKEKKECCYH